MAKAKQPFARLLRVSTTRIDGGSLFGSTAKERWERFVSPDRQNRVAIGNYSMLVNHPDGWILVNVGPGDKAPLSLDVAPMRSRSSLLRNLRELGLVPKDISTVVLTHMYDEYAGGGTHMTSSGRVLPTFPNARYVVQKEAVEEAGKPSERNARHYRPDDLDPLIETEQIEIVSGSKEIAKGVWVEPAPGPSAGHQIVIAEGPQSTYAFIGTLVPTSMHLCPQVVAASDRNPEATARTKQEVQKHARKEEWQIGPVGRDEWVGSTELASIAEFSSGMLTAPVLVTAKSRVREDVAAVA